MLLQFCLVFFTLIFTGIVAYSTVVYARLTGKLTDETRKMREAQTEPKISIIIQPEEAYINWIDMIIQNIGLGPAYNLKFEVNPDFQFRNHKISEIGFIKNGLRYLAPNQKMQFFITNLSEYPDAKPFEMKVSYQNSIGKSYIDIYLIDFSEFSGLLSIGKPPLHEIADNIKLIQQDINHIVRGYVFSSSK